MNLAYQGSIRVLKYIDMHLCFNRNKNLMNSQSLPAQRGHVHLEINV